ncbi:MAG: PaaI family thioesterase [Caulobacterales bacterium]
MDGETDEIWVHKPVESGPWAGWMGYQGDPFEDLTGPFYYRIDESGQAVSAFRAERKHMNGGGAMHGGCLMTFADYALFIIGREALRDSGSVTASLNGEFIDAAVEGEFIEARGEVVRAGGSLVFIRGLITTGGRPLFNFSGIVKKIRRQP